jgi:hypothetical protein
MHFFKRKIALFSEKIALFKEKVTFKKIKQLQANRAEKNHRYL